MGTVMALTLGGSGGNYIMTPQSRALSLVVASF